MCLNQVSCKRGKTDGETKKNQRENVFFQKYLQLFQAFLLLKNTKERSGETQKT